MKNAFREGEEVAFSNLEHLLDFDTDMFTLIIIGNSTTCRLRNWLITPRGYRQKYSGWGPA